MARRENEGDRYEGMISEDHSKLANLPQEVMMKSYPKTDFISYDYDDTIRRIDATIDDSVDKLEKHKSKSMY